MSENTKAMLAAGGWPPAGGLPQPTDFLMVEGANWVRWGSERPERIHAVRFADGSVFDTINGWRVLTNNGWRTPPRAPAERTPPLDLMKVANALRADKRMWGAMVLPEVIAECLRDAIAKATGGGNG